MAIDFTKINTGLTPNDGTGDSLRDAFIKVNNNYDLIGDIGLKEVLDNDSVAENVETDIKLTTSQGSGIIISDELTLLSNESINVNNEYTFPNYSGSEGQVLALNFLGDLEWVSQGLVSENDGYYIDFGEGQDINPQKGAVILSYQTSTEFSGEYAFSAGYNTDAQGNYDVAIGRNSRTDYRYSNSTVIGSNSVVQSNDSTLIGDEGFMADSTGSFIFGKGGLISSRPNKMVLGFYNNNLTTNDIIKIGTGTSDSDRRDSMTFKTNGLVTLPASTLALLNSASNDTLVTKEYVLSKVPTNVITEAPTDGKIYGRKDATWTEVTGGGTVVQNLVRQNSGYRLATANSTMPDSAFGINSFLLASSVHPNTPNSGIGGGTIMAGNGNFAPNSNNIISGSSNQIQSSGSINNILTGSNNDVTFSNSIGVGSGLTAVNGTFGQGLFGTFNNPNFNARLIVGIGSNNTTRKNGLEVLTSGLIQAPSTTNALINADTTGTVLVTKGWVQTQVSPSVIAEVSDGIRRQDIDQSFYSSIGVGAVDLSAPNSVGSYGATGNDSFATGRNNLVSGELSAVFGTGNVVSGTSSVSFGANNTADLNSNFVLLQGSGLTSKYSNSLIIGRYNANYGNGANGWVGDSEIFVVGNGLNPASTSNAYALFKDGKSIQNGIASYGADYSLDYTERSLVDKEYVDTQLKGSLEPTNISINKTLMFSPDLEDDVLNIRRYGANHTLINVLSPPQTSWGGAKESTLALVRGDNNEYFMDFYNMDYGTVDAGNNMDYGNPKMGIRLQKRGSGNLTEFNIEYSDGDWVTKAMQIVPNNTDGVNNETHVKAFNTFEVEGESTFKAVSSYDSDYSTSYTDRSLVDKGFVMNPQTFIDMLTNATPTQIDTVKSILGIS